MTSFQQRALLLIAIGLLIVGVCFRRSKVVLAGGLCAVGAYTLFALFRGDVSARALGLARPWLSSIAFAVGWLVLMLAYSPLADKIATRFVAAPPTLDAFRMLQQSRIKLLLGIVVAWILGGFLEELTLRGIVVQSLKAWLSPSLGSLMAAALAVCVAAAAAGLVHFYQGFRAVVIISQLSVLFGVLFVLSGDNLWAVILCHGMYDTIAFIRFANRKSRYANLDPGA
jgi:membrane protease YdiL (CAAX protease family)